MTSEFHRAEHVKEFDIDEILNLAGSGIKTFEINGENYEVNLNSDRYRHIKKNRTCACCGIRANRCFLDKDLQNSVPAYPKWHFNFYAENKDVVTNEVHYVLLTKDHIVPKSAGGTEKLNNIQIMCQNCNWIKDASCLTVEQMRKLLFPAYRAYRSTVKLNEAKELTKDYRLKIVKNRNSANAITRALEIVKDERTEGMKNKIAFLLEEADNLERECDYFELEVQKSGYCPDKFEIPK